MYKLAKVIVICIMSATYHLSLSAAPYTLEDFSYSATLSSANTSLRELDLPLSVYEKMQRKDYGDLRVFSGNGQLVPYQFSRIEEVHSQQQQSLVFYPFTKDQAADTGNIKVYINQKQQSEQTKPREQSIKIDQKWGGDFTDKHRSKEYQYIIENPQNKSKLCKIQLDWTQSKPSMVLPLTLESSNDLQHWERLSRKQSVSKLNYAGSRLIQNQISFSCTTKKYLRLTWLKPELQVHLQKVQGIFTSSSKTKTQWKSFGKPIQAKDNSWLFESDVVAGITKMQFTAPTDGFLYKGRLYVRNNENDKWRFIKNISQYRLNIGDTELQSSPFSLPLTKSRYWKLELDSESQFTNEQLPEIKAAWTPRKLLFLAQGKEPFYIAFGNPNIKPSEQSNLNQLVQTIRDSGSFIDNVTLGPIENTGKQFSPEIPWKLILFWIVLILGTLLMAYMVFRLYKQMGLEKAD